LFFLKINLPFVVIFLDFVDQVTRIPQVNHQGLSYPNHLNHQRALMNSREEKEIFSLIEIKVFDYFYLIIN